MTAPTICANLLASADLPSRQVLGGSPSGFGVGAVVVGELLADPDDQRDGDLERAKRDRLGAWLSAEQASAGVGGG